MAERKADYFLNGVPMKVGEPTPDEADQKTRELMDVLHSDRHGVQPCPHVITKPNGNGNGHSRTGMAIDVKQRDEIVYLLTGLNLTIPGIADLAKVNPGTVSKYYHWALGEGLVPERLRGHRRGPAAPATPLPEAPAPKPVAKPQPHNQLAELTELDKQITALKIQLDTLKKKRADLLAEAVHVERQGAQAK